MHQSCKRSEVTLLWWWLAWKKSLRMDKAKILGCRAQIHLCILKDWDALQVDLQAQKMPMRRRQDGFLRIALIAVQCFNTGSPVWAATELWLHGWQLENAMVPCPVTRERERERERQRERELFKACPSCSSIPSTTQVIADMLGSVETAKLLTREVCG